jgi:hypothetical protein
MKHSEIGSQMGLWRYYKPIYLRPQKPAPPDASQVPLKVAVTVRQLRPRKRAVTRARGVVRRGFVA